MTPEIYTAIKTRISAIMGADNKPLFKTVLLWNNQIDHLDGDKNDNYPMNFPACFIEFSNIVATNLGNKARVQQADFDTTFRMFRKYHANEDIAILSDKLKVYQTIQLMEFTSYEPEVSRFTRIGEQPNYDNNLLMGHDMTFHATYKDFSAVPAPNTGPVNTLTINPTIVTST